MNAGQTFHTPSFGDEEFEIPAAAPEHPYKYTEQPQPPALTTGGYNAGMFGESTMSDISDEGATLDQKRKKPRDPNEPQKPVSAYALFFRDTQAAIKGQNPNASFGEVSKIVASMWDALDPEHKNVYKKKAEAAKREYLKSLAIYRANSLSRLEETNARNAQDNDGGPPEKTASSRSLLSPEGLKSSSFEAIPKSLASAPAKDCPSAAGMLQAQSASTPQAQQQATMCQEQGLEGSGEGGLVQQCIRDGCTNSAIINSDWEDEYCSNECVVKHCRNVFAQWVQANALLPESYSSS